MCCRGHKRKGVSEKTVAEGVHFCTHVDRKIEEDGKKSLLKHFGKSAILQSCGTTHTELYNWGNNAQNRPNREFLHVLTSSHPCRHGQHGMCEYPCCCGKCGGGGST